MTISELADRAALPIATVKYYLRSGVLPGGHATSATRATYDESHLQRLRLIRALVTVGRLRLATVRDIMTAVDDPSRTTHEALGAAHYPPVAGAPEAEPTAVARVDELMVRLGWRVDPQSGDRRVLAGALGASAELGYPVDDEVLEAYAQAAFDVALVDVSLLPGDNRAGAVEMAVIGTVLREPVLVSLRRLAQEHVSAGRFG